MPYLAALASILAPILALIVPGIALVAPPKKPADLPATVARVVLWSISLLTLLALLLTAVALPPSLALIIALVLAGVVILRRRSLTRKNLWYLLTALTPILTIFALFAAPYLLFHDGLPTGDSQKAIIWAQDIIDNQRLPDFSRAAQTLNRDPVDFFTPGLHAYTAMMMQFTPNNDFESLYTVGFASIAISLAVSIITVAIATEILPRKHSLAAGALAAMFVLTHLRFLRYLREPGYHFQNVAGELLLFGLLYLALSLLRKYNRKDATLAIVTGAVLVLTHQFSMFIGVFILAPALIVAVLANRDNLAAALQHRAALVAALGTGAVLIVAGVALGLHTKIAHLFTGTPHLLSLTPTLADYARLMNGVWLLAGLAGLYLLLIKHRRPATYAFVFSTAALLMLSQGPRLGIDIPPVRALFYSIVPLSIAAAYLAVVTLHYIRQHNAPIMRSFFYTTFAAAIVILTGQSVAQAYQLSHTVRTNSTFLAPYQPLVKYLQKGDGSAVLVDDYNRRSASWLVISGRPMFTRIAADLRRQMNEARQSEARYQLYLNQLDFEKIYALGNLDITAQLLGKHNISVITGIESKSSASFARNPLLVPVGQGADVILYERQQTAAPRLSSAENWLLQPATLANDIGDDEDTFLHLPASLRATRLSQPLASDSATYRTTTSPLIPVNFNVGDYVQVLWDKEMTNQPDRSLELMLKLAQGPPQLTVSTDTGASVDVPTDGTLVKIAAADVPFNDKGYIMLTIHNPDQLPLNIDLIALGLARTP